MGEVYYNLAFDFGASSGRMVLCKLEDGKLELEELHRFPLLICYQYVSLLHLHGLYKRNPVKLAAVYCQKVSALIEEGDRIMLDASSTSLMIAKELKEKGMLHYLLARVSSAQEKPEGLEMIQGAGN